MEWLGKTTVLALGGELLAACTEADPMYPNPNVVGDSGVDALDEVGPSEAGGDSGVDALDDAGLSEAGGDSGVDVRGEVEPDGGRFPFYPGDTDSSLFDKWPVRTVDTQQLSEILGKWRLVVDGLVEEPLTFGFGDLLGLTASEQVTDFHCVEGWSVYDVPWNGVRFSEILEQVRPLPEATHLTFYSVGDVYLESIPIEIAKESKTMLAYGIGGMTIPMRHGFPLRLVVPRLLAYKNAKFIYRVELSDKAIDGYWVQRGYPYDANVPEGRLRQGKY